jgi:Arrestin (or S-antigen), C-terminal domain
MAHFYRACSIWPSLSIHDVLVPSTRPLVSTAVMTLSLGGSRNKLKLSARVPRPSYFAGQRCYVHVQIMNDTRRTVRSLCLTLIRTTTVYRPQSGKESRREDHDNDDHVSKNCQSKAFVDEISESRLAMAEPTTRRCASSKGWWTGVSPQERTAFTHSILIPVGPYLAPMTDELAHSSCNIFSPIHCQLHAPNSSLSTMLFVSPCTLRRVR